MTSVDESTAAPSTVLVPKQWGQRRMILGRRPAQRLMRGSRSAERTVGVGVLVVCLLAFIIVPFFSQDPNALSGLPQQPPSGANWFGTDTLGRDIFARIFMAGRLDLLITVVGVGVCIIVGPSSACCWPPPIVTSAQCCCAWWTPFWRFRSW